MSERQVTRPESYYIIERGPLGYAYLHGTETDILTAIDRAKGHLAAMPNAALSTGHHLVVENTHGRQVWPAREW